MPSSERSPCPRVGYVLKVYPRFSETFIVTEILAREAAGENLTIFSLRPPSDPRFHPELARVKAPVHYVERSFKLSEGWEIINRAQEVIEDFAQHFGRILPQLAGQDPHEVYQGIQLATMATLNNIDHLHAHFGSMTARTARIASLLTGIPYSFTSHAKDIFHESVDYHQLRAVLRDADHAVTISAYNHRFLSSLFPAETARLHLIYNGLELDRFTFRPPSPLGPALKLAAVGRLVEKKGFTLLIAAAQQLVHDGVRLDLRIAGGGELEEELKTQVRQAGLEEAVTLLGPQTQSEVAALLGWADVFAAPCVVGTDGNTDGLPTVLLEAMAMGVPVVASDVTGIPEVITSHPDGTPKTGVLVRAGSLEDLINALKCTALPDFERQQISRNARRLIESAFNANIQARLLGGLLSGKGHDQSKDEVA